ncbi:hypothetical protein A2422_00650 [Candidatus Woesebacteria bacterium RIFOXYC1_FULL_31_51]|nr:MAG: hypothetical protein UR17_C0001G0556 [Candidatus Woesebacteria bacterium GW2011_GWF1_31_35]OGM73571.1 MAG: hypothetical protein A2185_00260 [Candidatus Woesebacteria bacterium RIFOXYA1_FULL_31_71]OGM78610.1 MAG: hypothetical protein A2375_00480 [Candidatus Woesebacteria bacterium RIFOXYB1_FULL_31_120]OGM82361.1 MAG: hypothetical protein A2422_00650 [Candidatus Woesebacteria bacterium RIFOXYC1_FULL_31_51]OGM86479.1 MAG: hypothetical protein A2595_01040 [Candidatus Woesebacteria bacterium
MQEFGRILEEFKRRGGVVLSNKRDVNKKVLCPLNFSCKKANTPKCDMNCLNPQVERARRTED